MQLEGEGHCSVKNCRRIDPGLNLSCLLMAGVLFCLVVLLQQDTTLTILCRIDSAPDSSSCAAWSFEISSSVYQFTLWDDIGG